MITFHSRLVSFSCGLIGLLLVAAVAMPLIDGLIELGSIKTSSGTPIWQIPLWFIGSFLVLATLIVAMKGLEVLGDRIRYRIRIPAAVRGWAVKLFILGIYFAAAYMAVRWVLELPLYAAFLMGSVITSAIALFGFLIVDVFIRPAPKKPAPPHPFDQSANGSNPVPPITHLEEYREHRSRDHT